MKLCEIGSSTRAAEIICGVLVNSAMLRPQLCIDAIPYFDRVRDDPRSRPGER
jgi:hypothetical protein